MKPLNSSNVFFSVWMFDSKIAPTKNQFQSLASSFFGWQLTGLPLVLANSNLWVWILVEEDLRIMELRIFFNVLFVTTRTKKFLKCKRMFIKLLPPNWYENTPTIPYLLSVYFSMPLSFQKSSNFTTKKRPLYEKNLRTFFNRGRFFNIVPITKDPLWAWEKKNG